MLKLKITFTEPASNLQRQMFQTIWNYETVIMYVSCSEKVLSYPLILKTVIYSLKHCMTSRTVF